MQSKMKEKDKFTEWYKKQIESNPYDPPETVWNNIHDELDVDNVWQRISSSLQKEQRKELFLYIAAAAVILLFFLLYPFQVQKSHNIAENEINKNFTDLEITAKQDKLQDIFTHEDHLQESFKPKPPAFFSQENGKIYIASLPNKKSDEKTNTKKTPTKNELIKQETLLAGINTPQSQPNLAVYHSNQSNQKRTEEKEKKEFEPRFYAGISGKLGRSWLLSNKTIYSITNSPYSSANPKEESSFGLFGGVKLSERWAFELGASFNGNKGQIYKEYMDGQLVNNQITLNYSTLNMKGRYKFISKASNRPVSHNIVFGTYMGYLGNASQKIESSSSNIKSDYRNYDLGLIFGYEIDAQILPNYSLSTGIQIGPGLINIYKGNEALPASFNKTYNASIGINISVKRSF